MADRHREYPDDYISVTRPFEVITAPQLEVWKVKIGEVAAQRIATKAANWGKKIHSYCEAICKRELDRAGIAAIPPAYRADVLKFYDWFEINVEEVLAVERQVWSDEDKVGGILDIVLCLKKTSKWYDSKIECYLTDIKTGRLKAIAKMQLAAYHHCACKTLKIDPAICTGRLILGVSKKLKKVKVVKFEPEKLEKDWQAFLHLAAYYRWALEEDVKI